MKFALVSSRLLCSDAGAKMTIETLDTVGTAFSRLLAWRAFDPDQHPIISLPARPGLVRVRDAEAGWREFIVLDVQSWMTSMREDLLAQGSDGNRHVRVEWCTPAETELERYVGVGPRPSALAPGRPTVVASPSGAPAAWGLYRIHRMVDDTWYVGISSNLRRRLSSHVRSGLFTPDDGDTAEVLPAREPTSDRIVVWFDLQAAEAEHIRRLRDRGLNVINITQGGNGRPPVLRLNLAALAAQEMSAANQAPIRQPRRNHVDLALRWRTPEEDWDIWLREDDTICAVPGSHGSRSYQGRDASWDEIREHYSMTYGRDLDQDLVSVERSVPTDTLPVLYWSAERRQRYDGKLLLPPDELNSVSSSDVRSRLLPDSLQGSGLRVDASAGRHNGVNETMRIHGDGVTGLWAKTEENKHAVRAELLASTILTGLRWPGLSSRAKTNASGSVIITSDVGTETIEDLKSFAAYFRWGPDEARSTLRHDFAGALKYVTLADLTLRNPLDCLSLLLFDAVICNTDRNKTNLHYGHDRQTATGQPSGCLLPLDHGRSVFNSDPSRPGSSNVTPIGAVTGASTYANPNQMLRPVSELVAQDMKRCVDHALGWLTQVTRVAQEMRPGWEGYGEELAFITANADDIASDVRGFLDHVCLMVRS